MAFYVSTHSRPKAAGFIYLFDNRALRRFNTQPPEGGWKLLIDTPQILLWFQHTAARRRLGRKEAKRNKVVCFNTQPPEGGWAFARS